ncbi:hypothetical protein BDZ94DRAFT_1250736 [Collybia nuda]|uniref:Uncharacterized protein n=1 Tax=Collybia nuda TaxID=64659 RepID=A0A9P5YDP6_9AGAR|nr:hypothetical protein BDZ94DRAFT_1250736 [Collybia nuda]
MNRLTRAVICLLICNFVLAAVQDVFPPADPPYSSTFIQPQPPNITAEFRAHFMQHKYDSDITHNHIFSGFLYMSPSNRKIRLDGADDGNFQASLLDFNNSTDEGLVSNILFNYAGDLTTPTCSYFFVPPFIPLFAPDFLGTQGAVYTGIQKDEVHGPCSTWVFMFGNDAVTAFLDSKNTLVRYDFVSPGDANLRTYATTRFFNIIPGTINATVFNNTCL